MTQLDSLVRFVASGYHPKRPGVGSKSTDVCKSRNGIAKRRVRSWRSPGSKVNNGLWMVC